MAVSSFVCVLLAVSASGGAILGAHLPSRQLQFLKDAVESGGEAFSDGAKGVSDGAKSVTDKFQEGKEGLEDTLGENLDALGDVGECLKDPEECKEKLEEVEDCFDDPLGCASNKIKELLPDIDITTCDTDEVKEEFTDGGWSASYGPRLWDSKSVATVVGFFFPATAPAAARTFVKEMKKQSNELVEKLNKALEETEEEASENLEEVMKGIFDKIIEGDLSKETFDSPNLDLKLQFLRVECKNKVGTVEIPSEGYIRWGFGWRFKGASVSSGEDLPSDLESTSSLEDFDPAED